jgi:hypothetical protein
VHKVSFFFIPKDAVMRVFTHHFPFIFDFLCVETRTMAIGFVLHLSLEGKGGAQSSRRI